MPYPANLREIQACLLQGNLAIDIKLLTRKGMMMITSIAEDQRIESLYHLTKKICILIALIPYVFKLTIPE